MADDKRKEQNQQRDQNTERTSEKAMGAAATVGAQGQQGSGQQDQQDQQGLGRNPQGTETAGQGGGIQGTGQRQRNPGGFSSDQDKQRDDRGGQSGGQRDDQGRQGPSKR